MTPALLLYIRLDEPRSTKDLWLDLCRLRKHNAFEDLPSSQDLLANDLLQGVLDGDVEERDGKWYAVVKAARLERTLF